jgi:hypothetical protein
MGLGVKGTFLKSAVGAAALATACGLLVLAPSSHAATGFSGSVSTHVRNSGAVCSTSYQHVYVTVNDVTAHMSGKGWQDLTPGLSAAPIQIDLLAEAPTDCFLATLGVTSGLPAGKYQQIRIILDDTGKSTGKGKGKKKGGGTPPSVNACSSLVPTTYNCIDLGGGNLVPLSLSSEGKTGIKIPPGQIAGGGLVIAAGQGADLDIDFNACKSIVKAGKSGKYKLKPTLHAGEIDLSALVGGDVVEGSISGSDVTPGATTVPGANLWLESQTPVSDFAIGTPIATIPTAQVENVVATATSDALGHFEFCPVPAGTYELVADADPLPSSGDSSNATITTDVVVTSSGGPNNLVIPLLDDGTSSALLEGLFTTQATASAGTGDNIDFGGVQPFAGTSGTVQAIVPPLSLTVPAPAAGALPSVATITAPTAANCPDIASPSCPTGTNCECFTLALPASNPVIGAAGSTYAVPAASPSPAGYAVIGAASQLASPATPDCVPADLITDPASPFVVTGGAFTLATNPTLSFTGCN